MIFIRTKLVMKEKDQKSTRAAYHVPSFIKLLTDRLTDLQGYY